VRALFLLPLLLAASIGVADASSIGVLLLHGKTGTPEQLAKLSAALTAAGYAVATPEMCWSKTRIFDKALPDCLKELDASIGLLKSQGATEIVIGGTSQGAVAAIDYGAVTAAVAGIIAMAPAADPADPSKFPDFAAAIQSALAAVKTGKADDRTAFADLANGQIISVSATAAAFLSFHDPASPVATIREVKAKLLPKLGPPLLWIAGTGDPTQSAARSVFGAARKNALSSFVEVDADHVSTPDASADAIIAWLKTLP
jgi:esterase/lipase